MINSCWYAESHFMEGGKYVPWIRVINVFEDTACLACLNRVQPLLFSWLFPPPCSVFHYHKFSCHIRKFSFCFRVFFDITQFNTHNYCCPPKYVPFIEIICLFSFCPCFENCSEQFFHDFPGWKMKFLNSMTCTNPNFNYHSSNLT